MRCLLLFSSLAAPNPYPSQTVAQSLFSYHRPTKKATGRLFKTDQSPPGSRFPPSTPNHPGKVGFEPCPLGPPPTPARSRELGITVTSARKSDPLAACGALVPPPETHKEGWRSHSAPSASGALPLFWRTPLYTGNRSRDVFPPTIPVQGPSPQLRPIKILQASKETGVTS